METRADLLLAEFQAKNERKAKSDLKQTWLAIGLTAGFLIGVGLAMAGVKYMLMPTAESNAQALVACQASAAGFTVLIEPAPAQTSSALQLFDVLRPGLGTMLAKLQTTAQSQQIAVKWVVAGHVKPAADTPGSSYCWLKASGEVETCRAVSQ